MKGFKMSLLPSEVIEQWNNHAGPVVLTTVDNNGIPNAIYATCVGKYSDEILVVADNYFDKTRKNILAGSKASLLFITEENKSYQIKGTVELLESGPIFDDMKTWNPEKHPGRAAAAITVEEVYSGAEKIV